MKSPVTSKDVATLAGVSQSQVSRAFTPGGSVSKHTRARILDAAGKLGYRRNQAARSLSTKQSHTIAIVVGYLHNQFYPKALDLLTQLLGRNGYGVLLFISDHSVGESAINRMLQHQVDGVIMASASLSSPLARALIDLNIPTVLINRRPDGDLGSSITADNWGGGSAIASHFIEIGCKTFGFVGGSQESSTNRDRFAGFKSQLRKSGLRINWSVMCDYDPSKASSYVHEAWQQGVLPEGLFVANDHMAFSVLDTLRFACRLNVPDDVVVAGFDNVALAASPSFDLTTYSQPVDRMVQDAVDLLLRSVRDREQPREHRVVQGILHCRGTTRRKQP